jgi:hypothetical protein
VSTPGDGFVRVACTDLACACEWTRPHADPPLRATFELDALPDGDDACKRLLLERCMRGMRLAPSESPED